MPRQTFGHWEAFCLSSRLQGPSSRSDHTSNSYALNYRELATLLTQSEILAEDGLKPLIIESMCKNLTNEIS